jgi:hypothetical protein
MQSDEAEPAQAPDTFVEGDCKDTFVKDPDRRSVSIRM